MGLWNMNFVLLLIFVVLSRAQESSINMNYLLDSPSAGGDVHIEETLVKESINITLLNCTEFDADCRWHNLRDSSVDLKWYQSNAYLDPSYFQLATGSHVLPTSVYAVAASDDPSKNNSKAILMSDVVSCPFGTDQFSLMYWLSPWVKMSICIKSTMKTFPNYDFCSNFPEKASPGPVNIVIPPMGNMTFQIFMIASNFTYQSTDFRGGFAILDNMTISIKSCTQKPVPAEDYEDMILTSILPADEFEVTNPVMNSSTINPMTTTGIMLFTFGVNAPVTTTTTAQESSSSTGNTTTTTVPILQTPVTSSMDNTSSSDTEKQETNTEPVITSSVNPVTTRTTTFPTDNSTNVTSDNNTTSNPTTDSSIAPTTIMTATPSVTHLITTEPLVINSTIPPTTSSSNLSTATTTLPILLTSQATNPPSTSVLFSEVTGSGTKSTFPTVDNLISTTTAKVPSTPVEVMETTINEKNITESSEVLQTTTQKQTTEVMETTSRQKTTNAELIETSPVPTTKILETTTNPSLIVTVNENSSNIVMETTANLNNSHTTTLELMKTTPEDSKFETTLSNTESLEIKTTTQQRQDTEVVMETTLDSQNTTESEFNTTASVNQIETTTEQNVLTSLPGSTTEMNFTVTSPADNETVVDTTPNSDNISLTTKEEFSATPSGNEWELMETTPKNMSVTMADEEEMSNTTLAINISLTTKSDFVVTFPVNEWELMETTPPENISATIDNGETLNATLPPDNISVTTENGFTTIFSGNESESITTTTQSVSNPVEVMETTPSENVSATIDNGETLNATLSPDNISVTTESVFVETSSGNESESINTTTQSVLNPVEVMETTPPSENISLTTTQSVLNPVEVMETTPSENISATIDNGEILNATLPPDNISVTTESVFVETSSGNESESINTTTQSVSNPVEVMETTPPSENISLTTTESVSNPVEVMETTPPDNVSATIDNGEILNATLPPDNISVTTESVFVETSSGNESESINTTTQSVSNPVEVMETTPPSENISLTTTQSVSNPVEVMETTPPDNVSATIDNGETLNATLPPDNISATTESVFVETFSGNESESINTTTQFVLNPVEVMETTPPSEDISLTTKPISIVTTPKEEEGEIAETTVHQHPVPLTTETPTVRTSFANGEITETTVHQNLTSESEATTKTTSKTSSNVPQVVAETTPSQMTTTQRVTMDNIKTTTSLLRDDPQVIETIAEGTTTVAAVQTASHSNPSLPSTSFPLVSSSGTTVTVKSTLPPPFSLVASSIVQAIPDNRQEVCRILTCTFEETSPCSSYVQRTAWTTGNTPVGDLNSTKTHNVIAPQREGEMFAFISGPIRWSRILTPPFELPNSAIFTFEYRTALDNLTFTTFTVFVKRNDTIVETVLAIPIQFSDSSSTSWKNSSTLLLTGAYEYIAFEVRNLRDTELIGIDNFQLTEFLGRGSFCT